MVSTVREATPGFFVIETGGKLPLGNVVDHFELWPLLGEKSVSFSKFRDMYRDKYDKIE